MGWALLPGAAAGIRAASDRTAQACPPQSSFLYSAGWRLTPLLSASGLWVYYPEQVLPCPVFLIHLVPSNQATSSQRTQV